MNDFNENEDGLVPAESETQEPMSMTLSGIGRAEGDLSEADGLDQASSSGGGLLSHSAVLLVAVVVVAIGSLYLMRATQGDLSNSKEAQEIEAKIANTLDRLNKPSLLQSDDPLLAANLDALLTSTDDVTAIFAHDVREQQVPIEQVKKDPFSLASDETRSHTINTDTSNRQDRRRLTKLRNEAGTLALQSIMLGTRNIAVIDGEFYKRGDRLGSFTIAEIEKFTVHLQAAGSMFELTLQSGP